MKVACIIYCYTAAILSVFFKNAFGVLAFQVIIYNIISMKKYQYHEGHLDIYFSVCSDAGDSLNDCRIMFLTEIYKIEEVGSLDETPAGSESPLKSRFNCVNWYLLHPLMKML